jgi:hypothetical protein
VCSITSQCQRIFVILFSSANSDDDNRKFLITFFKVEKRENDGRDLIDKSVGVEIFKTRLSIFLLQEH